LVSISPQLIKLSCLDLSSGTETYMTGLSERVNQYKQEGFFLYVSPDGEHFVWQTKPGIVCGSMLDGSRYFECNRHYNRKDELFDSQSRRYDKIAWLNDSRHWVEIPTEEDTKNDNWEIRIHDFFDPMSIRKQSLEKDGITRRADMNYYHATIT